MYLLWASKGAEELLKQSMRVRDCRCPQAGFACDVHFCSTHYFLCQQVEFGFATNGWVCMYIRTNSHGPSRLDGSSDAPRSQTQSLPDITFILWTNLRLPSSPLEITRVPFFLLFGFHEGTKKEKRAKGSHCET